jgi:hypothetical protein
MKKFLAIFFVIIAFAVMVPHIPISFYPLNRLLIRAAESRLKAEIRCRSLELYAGRKLVAKGIEAIGKGGFGLNAESAVIAYDPVSVITGRLHLACDFKNVNFYRAGSIMNSLSDMLQMRPLGDLTFDSITGDLYVGMTDTITQDINLTSDTLRIRGNAVTRRDDTILCFLKFLLKDEAAEDIPEEVRRSLLKKEEGSWSSIFVGIMGDYRKPSLRIITDHFRMNVFAK